MPTVTVQRACELALQHHRDGRLAEAEALYRQILEVQPNHFDALHLLGVIAHQSGRGDVAVDLMRRAIALHPNHPSALFNIAEAYQAMGRLDEAIAHYQQAVRFQPNDSHFHHHLGIALTRRGRLDEAIAAFRAALQLNPQLADAHGNLGTALAEQNQLAEAIAAFERALALKPESASIHRNLGIVLSRQGRLDEAITAFRRALELQPDDAEARNILGVARAGQGRLDEAVAAYRQAILLRPQFPDAWNNLGLALDEQYEIEEALAAFRRALEFNPHSPEINNNFAGALARQGRLDEALDYHRRAVQWPPGNAGPPSPAIHPPGHLAGIYDSYLANLHYWSSITPQELLDAHRGYDVLYAQPWRAVWQPHSNSRDPARALRVGFISPHFCLHPVGHFLVRMLENLPRDAFQAVCYSDSGAPDLMTARLRACTAEWHETRSVSDEELARRIREDRIDILFDLAGHTPGNRLLVFARKPAPVQISWLDYVGTTGLSAMDYLLADPRQIPPEAEPFYSEKVLRLPDDYICFDPPADAPTVGPLPAQAKGFVTFASFNLLKKTTAQIVEVWSRILDQVPDARLLLKNHGLDRPVPKARLRQQFSEHSIDPSRIIFQGWSPHAELLGAYNEADIALDTFPYNGGLTTCEALWMGIPVVTCPGETFASRHGLAHLTAAGLPETIATDCDDYARIAVALAHDLPRLAALREGLRARVGASALCDGHRFAQNFAALLRGVWRQWCQGI